MLGLIGKKIGMTRVYDHRGRALACTVVEAGPCQVVQIKTAQADRYAAVQLGYLPQKESRLSKALLGHFKKGGVAPMQKLVEFRDSSAQGAVAAACRVGQAFRVEDVFSEGEQIDVVGRSKGKGFQGVMKRHGFRGTDSTHGGQSQRRATGSVGAGSTPSRVFKGKKMAGQTGGVRCKVRNVRVLKVVADKNLIILQGALPGPNKGYLILKK